jgi:hypothetical protein
MLALFFVVFCCVESFAAGKGSTAWSIFRRPQSSKPDAITAVASIRGDLSGVFYNPSTLGTITRREMFFMTELGMAEDSFQGAIFGMPMGKSGLAIGYIMYDAGSTTLYWIDGGTEMSDDVSLQKDSLALLSYGFQLSGHFSMGLSLKYATSNIAEMTPNSSATCGDVGLIYTSGINGISISLAGQNLGSPGKIGDTEEELPESQWLGIAYTHTVGDNNFIGIGVDAGYLVREARTLPGIGVEYDMGNFGFNVGYYAMRTDEASFQIGFGFASSSFELGYAYLPAQFLNSVHRINLSFLF